MSYATVSARSVKSLLITFLAYALLFSSLMPLGRATEKRPATGDPISYKKLGPVTSAASTASARVRNALGTVPIAFEANQGQADSRVKFLSRGSGYTLLLTSTEAVLNLDRPVKENEAHTTRAGSTKADRNKLRQRAVIRMKFAGANSNPRIEGLDKQSGKVNYFTGKDPKQWRTGLTNYSRVKYHQIYPGVDLLYYGNGAQLEYDFVIASGADPKKIKMEFKGADKLEVDTNGDLVLNTTAGEVRHRKPVIYQDVNGERREVSGAYLLKGKHRVGFKLGDYDASKPLVIDPVISYSTLLGGSGGLGVGSWATGIATYTAADGNVYVYVVGITTQTDFPVRNAAQPAFGGTGPTPWVGDVFVSKFNMAASGDASLVYSTYLGGMGNENGAGIAVDSVGNAYVTGFTASTDFPILKAAQSSFGGSYFSIGDAFVTALNQSGSSLIYSTYLGGSQDDAAASVAVDSSGNAYVTGKTSSVNFPMVNAYQSTPHGSNTTFVAKLAPPIGSTPASLVYSTYLGGSSHQMSPCLCAFHEVNERGTGIAVDSGGNAYVTGTTGSPDFPILNGFQTTLRCASGNVFLTKLNPSASGSASLLYSTYLGGSCDYGGDTGMSVALDSTGNAYVTGETYLNDFPTTPGAFMRNRRTRITAFVAKIDPSKNGADSLIYSTLLGGFSLGAPEAGRSIAVDVQGNAYVTGETHSFDFPLVNAAQTLNNGVFQSIDSGTSWTVMNGGLAVTSITALAIDASTSPRTLYAGSVDHENVATGGVFKSVDGGRSWSPINTGLNNTNVRALAISPTTPSTLYVATYAGMFKSIDGGGNWSAFNAGLSVTASGTTYVLSFDTRTSPATLYAGTDEGLYKVSDGSSNWVLTGHTTGVRSITIDPRTSDALYLLDSDFSCQRSVDGANTWSIVQTPDRFAAFGVDPATTPSTLFGTDHWGDNFYKSIDGGNSWESLGTHPGGYRGVITADTTTTPSTLYISHYEGGFLVRSTDGGHTWTQLFSIGVGAFALDTGAATASTPSALYVAASGSYLSNVSDAFVSKLDSTGSTLLFSTALGSFGSDFGYGIALDSSGNIYVAGKTQEGLFPTVNAYQATSRDGLNSIDAFVVKLGSAALPSSSTGSVTTEMAVQTGTLELSFPNITGSISGTTPTATVNPLDSTTTANLTLSNNLGAYEIKTTATYDTSGYETDPTKGIKIAFTVPTVNDLTVFNNLVITHGEDSNGDNVIQPSEMIPYNGTVDPNKITYHDFDTRTIWVFVPSLSPFVIVKGAADQFSDLVRLIKSFNLKAGIENSLDTKLQNALKAYQAALAKDRPTACNQMGAFTSEVRAQTNKSITLSQADQLLSAANQIKRVVGCQ